MTYYWNTLPMKLRWYSWTRSIDYSDFNVPQVESSTAQLLKACDYYFFTDSAHSKEDQIFLNASDYKVALSTCNHESKDVLKYQTSSTSDLWEMTASLLVQGASLHWFMFFLISITMGPMSLDELKKRFYDIRSLTKRKMAEIQKQAGVTGGGRNPAPPLTELEELVSSTIERESVTGIGTLDSSARATATGAPSGGQTLPKEAAAPSTTALAGPSTSQAAEEEEENTIGLDIEGDLEIDFDALHSPQMQSTPSLQFSPENSPTRELFPPTPAPATVAPVHPVLGAGAQAPASTTPPPVAPQPTQQAGSSSTRRRAIPTTADPAREASVFRGLEGNMVKIQRQQAKSIMACQRQLLQHNLQMGEMVKGFQAFVASNKEAVAGLGRLTTAITQLCGRMEEQEVVRRRDARVQNRSLSRLAAATAQLCQRGANMESSLAQNTAELTRGMARITTAMEALIISNTAANPALDLGDAGDSSSRSSPASAASEPRRSTRRSADAAGHSEGGEGHHSGAAKRSKK
ncbi:uncharacterized protein LOC144790758 [Lissotriton helveticus]